MTGQEQRVNVLLVDNRPSAREGLVLLLEGDGIGVCAQAKARRDALGFARKHSPDLALVDLSSEEDDRLSLISELSERGIPVVVCSTQEGPALVQRAIRAGARAYVSKREAGQCLPHVIRDVLAGWMLVSPRAASDLDEDR